MLRDQPVWIFDVDGTLIGSIRSERLRPGAVELLDALRGSGVRCVLWSAGGADYARRMAEKHAIAHSFVAFYSKATRGGDGRFDTDHFAAADLPSMFVDDAPSEVPDGVPVVAVRQFLGGNLHDRMLFEVVDRLPEFLAPVSCSQERAR